MTDNIFRRWFWGPLSRLGIIAALLSLIVDQIHKTWMLRVYKIAEQDVVNVGPFFDLVLVWNKGISYGLFQQDGLTGRLALVIFAVLACLALLVVLARSESVTMAVSVGLIIGGALGNAVDRLIYGAVADFFSLHAFGLYWYVFNIADVAIVAGAVGLLYDSLVTSRKKV